ncbi:hypothetical protein TTHERM_000392769 (macronuclear) [Tetrahymena thermophila SB210]|uniref:Uncharacterized protein n=1 Tax=Tetrahymena thermophila (strain SB210) TaxID=312017 RepID=W7XD99_TETTS|nr:hypothetical protein TTHERM_000392769 [Tetrahymena thermophila SB210]EWS75492.1 hypothetical protein TTHERM_000392769 [Tetrahymena thermophila SB210]|eukprot:XP_012651961.1 hypothetical protein TTHERM_000392769 [Tetrahymena thermophila SB210]
MSQFSIYLIFNNLQNPIKFQDHISLKTNKQHLQAQIKKKQTNSNYECQKYKSLFPFYFCQQSKQYLIWSLINNKQQLVCELCLSNKHANSKCASKNSLQSFFLAEQNRKYLLQ